MSNKHWFKERKYLHFSPPIKFDDYPFICSYISNSSNVKKHAFYPLIHRVIVEKRYKKINIGDKKIVRSHYDYKNRKSTAKQRQIYFSNHLDSHIYAYYAKEVIGKKYEDYLRKDLYLNKSICAYRYIETHPNSTRGKSNIHFAKEVFDNIKIRSSCIVLCFDIEKFFDNLNHNILKKMWCEVIGERTLPEDQYSIYKFLTNFTYVEEADLLKNNNYHFVPKSVLRERLRRDNFNCYCPNKNDFKEKIIGRNNFKKQSLIKFHPFKNQSGYKKGIPQGTALSALLANIYMLGFDKVISSYLASIGGLYRRYSDDIIVIIKEEEELEFFKIINNEIKNNFLVFNEKTERIRFLNGKSVGSSLKYLGFEFDGFNIRVKSSSIAKYYRKVKKFIKVKAIRAYYLQKKQSTIHTQIHKRSIYSKYSHLGRKNYVSYMYKSSNIMKSKTIRCQIKRHLKVINEYMIKWENKLKLPKY